MTAFNFLFLVFACLTLCVFVQSDIGSANETKCIGQLLQEIPQISLLAGNVNTSKSLAQRVYACDEKAPLTLFAPSNSAVLEAISRVMHRVKTISSGTRLNSGVWWTVGNSRLDSETQNISSVGMDPALKSYLKALAHLHVTVGNWSSEMLSGVHLLNSTLVNDSQYVLLGKGESQRLMVLNAFTNASTGNVSKDATHQNQHSMESLLNLQKNYTFANATSKVVFAGEQFYSPRRDAKVILPNIRAKDGFIHVIDRVLELPLNTTAQLETANLTLFHKLIHAAELSELLNNESSITVFAPTNAALHLVESMLANGSLQISAFHKYRALYQKRVLNGELSSSTEVECPHLFGLPKHSLQNLLKNHVFNDTVYSPDFLAEPALVSVNGTRYNVTTANATAGSRANGIHALFKHWIHLLEVSKNATEGTFKIGNITIVFANIVTRNGVIHVIDGVLGVNVSGPTQAPHNVTSTINASTTPLQPQPLPQPTSAPTSTQTPWIVPQPFQISMSSIIQSGICCLNNTGLAIFLNFTIGNRTLTAPEGSRRITVSGAAQCPASQGLCYVAALSKSCALSSTGKYQWTMATPSQVNAKYTNEIDFVGTCYDPNTHVCVDNHFLCPNTHPTLCGDSCYDAAQYLCYQAFTMCPASAPYLCGPGCYHPDNYECQAGQIIQRTTAKQP